MGSHVYRVTAPYVTLKVKDQMTGGDVIAGFYEGAVVENIDEESLKHHLSRGMVEQVDSPTDEPSGEATPPAGNASREEWAEFATLQGASEEDLLDEDGKELGRDEIRAKFGSTS